MLLQSYHSVSRNADTAPLGKDLAIACCDDATKNGAAHCVVGVSETASLQKDLDLVVV